MPSRPPAFPAAVTFGQRMRERREELHLTQEALADKIGLHWTYVGSAERGRRNVSLRNLLRIAQGLDIDLAELVRGLRAD